MLKFSSRIAAFLILGFILTAPLKGFAQASLSAGGAGELYFPLPLQNSVPDGERARIRSVELTAQTKLDAVEDPSLRAKMTIGADDVSGALVLNLREGFLVASDLITKDFSLRAGKFFLPIGILNQTRRSAWAFSTAPQAFNLFFDPAGVADTGLDLNYRFSPSFQLRAGVTNGYRYDSGISNGGTRPMTPTHFARPEIEFVDRGTNYTIGLNYLSRMSDAGELMRISGIDFRSRPMDASPQNWKVEGEFYLRSTSPANLPLTEDMGGYLYYESVISPSWLSGFRFDEYQVRTLKDASGNSRANQTFAFDPILTYVGRDHLRLQGSYTYLQQSLAGNADHLEQMFEIRLITEFGDIPKTRGMSPDPSSP